MKYKAVTKRITKTIDGERVRAFFFKRMEDDELAPFYFAIIPSKEAKKVKHIFPVVNEDQVDHEADFLDLDDFDVAGCILQGDSIEEIEKNLDLWISMSEE